MEPVNKRGDTEFGTIMPDYDVLPDQVQSAVDELNEDCWEVKSITPISAILRNTEDMLGLIKSNAGSQTVQGTYTAGVIILAQRWRELSETEAAERESQKEAKSAATQARLKAEADEARKNAGPTAYSNVMSMPIRRTGGIMSSMWTFNGQEYHTEGMAQRARQEMADRAKVEAESNSQV